MTFVIEQYNATEETLTATIEIDKFSSAYKLIICRYYLPDLWRVYPVRKTYYKTVKAAQQALKRYGKANCLTWIKQ